MTLSVAQLAALGGSLVFASFALNAFMVRSIVADFRQRLDRIEKGISGESGLLVRVAVLEDRRTGPADRRHSG